MTPLMKLGGIWTNYNSSNSPLPNGQFVDRFATGPDGRVWMKVVEVVRRSINGGTSTEGKASSVLLFRNETWALFPISSFGLPDSDVEALGCDAQGSLWLAMSNGALRRFDGQERTLFAGGELGLAAPLG